MVWLWWKLPPNQIILVLRSRCKRLGHYAHSRPRCPQPVYVRFLGNWLRGVTQPLMGSWGSLWLGGCCEAEPSAAGPSQPPQLTGDLNVVCVGTWGWGDGNSELRIPGNLWVANGPGTVDAPAVPLASSTGCHLGWAWQGVGSFWDLLLLHVYVTWIMHLFEWDCNMIC